ncbi:hypothetical protein GUJ93_ZPchr0001g33072 [Zizania palustris]|uniref:Uncharacterized protein n=1 Tax=Zizania palustris TaxID=103762 RepID=A0A8J5RWA1_ZIZPA|nr:hypothetical protein GUJ93_ZPchr0001g33072 [Zizania palustris]
MPLDTFDMVLGVQWLRTLRQILWDFTNKRLSFQHHGRPITWSSIDAKASQEPRSYTCSGAEVLDELLDEFADLFDDPHGLPPPPPEHLVHTDMHNTKRMSLRGSAWTCLSKALYIRHSSSPFSAPAPVLLVKKHDGTW